jgi:hypothetical protein
MMLFIEYYGGGRERASDRQSNTQRLATEGPKSIDTKH